jgi:tetratricopeptide (TPR) repeat protein
MGKELEAAQALQAFVDLIDKDPATAGRAAEFRNLDSVRSRLHYFYAVDLLSQGKVKEATDHLDRGVQSDPKDADVLIALFRLPDQSAERRKQTLTYITNAAEHFRGEINRVKPLVDQDPNEAQKFRIGEYLANQCNQLAWLIGNTTGDFDEALQCSLKSNELMPKYAAYLDTLGRCYYAKGDYDNAIKYQTLALQEEPHSGQMKRQLAQFVKERDAKKAAGPPLKEAQP